MDSDSKVLNSRGTKYYYAENGNHIIIYTNSDSNTLETPQKDRFLGTIIKDVKDLRALKDIDGIKKVVKNSELNYNENTKEKKR